LPTLADARRSPPEARSGRARRELVARIFDQYYRPRFGLGENPPEADGALAGTYQGDSTL
jgi:hypothetical protein